MSLQIAQQALEKWKKPEERLPQWNTVLTDMFLLEQSLLNEVIADSPDVLPTIPQNPTEAQVGVILSTIKPLEEKLALLKKKQTDVMGRRKVFTSKLDAVTERMMVPEKTYKAYIDNLAAGLLLLKRFEQQENNKKLEKARQLQNHRTWCQQKLNEDKAELLKHIQRIISADYIESLEKVSVENIAQHVQDLKNSFTLARCTHSNNTFKDAEFQNICDEVFKQWNPNEFIVAFHEECDNAFANFAVAKNNKLQAVEDRNRQQQAAEQEVDFDLNMNDQVAELDAKVEIQVPVVVATKVLKKVFVLDMAHTEENMTIIIRAFFANFVACMANIRRADPFSIDINCMADALVKLKNGDKNLKMDGIIFKEEDKL